ncbi:MAG TPA: serine/threonine-protein kinase, partial [Polyangiaceae bacterium]|nr:serine/threonine-protein kinase [Polyangiaceae bacterium]
MNEPRVSRIPKGVLLGSAYRVEEWLGGGGYGEVYRAHSLRMDRPVAIKVMKPQASRVTRERFAREAQLTKRLEHPNTVRLLDFGGLDDDQPFLVWELLRGETLAERLERKGPMPPEEVANMARQVLSSLEEAHGLGIIHR